VKPEELLYAKTHEWTALREEGGQKIATVGISAFAVEQLTDLVYMQLPAVPKAVKAGQPFAEIESVKAVSDIYSPVEGEIIEVNTPLKDKLDTLSQDPFGGGWIAKIKLAPGASTSHLMKHADYKKQCEAEGH
jgi:glycine cleavage system H protein